MWIRRLFKQGHSVAVTLPKDAVRDLKWLPGMQMMVSMGDTHSLTVEELGDGLERRKAKRKAA